MLGRDLPIPAPGAQKGGGTRGTKGRGHKRSIYYYHNADHTLCCFMANTSFLLRDIERSPLFLLSQTHSKSLGISITKGDVSGDVVSEKHVRNCQVFIWRNAVSSYM